MILVWSGRVIRERERERVHTEGSPGVGITSGICFRPKFSTSYNLITPTRSHIMLASHWSRPHLHFACFSLVTATPTQRLPLISHSQHSHNACLSWVTAHTHAALASHWSRPHPRSACLSLVTANTPTTLASHESRPTPTQYLPLIGPGQHPCSACFRIVLLILSMTWYIWQHPPVSWQVKVIYDTSTRRYPAEIITDTDYADEISEISLLANTPSEAESLQHSLEQVVGDINLYVNVDKMECICFDR